MKNLMKYKGYWGSVEYSEEDNCLFGKILGIRGLISYEGQSVEELKKYFHEAVDEYFEDCKAEDRQPEKPFKGGFNIRIGIDLHRKAFIYAQEHDTSLNSLVAEALKEKLDRDVA